MADSPARSTRNLVKFHLIAVVQKVPRFSCFRNWYSGWASSLDARPRKKYMKDDRDE